MALGLTFMAVGLTLINDPTCEASCQTAGLTLLYAGLPISAVIGVLFGELVLAWPLDITFWVVLSFGLARFVDNRDRSIAGAVLVTAIAALVYGLVLSFFVEIAIP